MTPSDFMLFFILAAFLVLATRLTYLMGKQRRYLALSITGLVWLVFTVAMFFGLENAGTWDGFTYMAAVWGISAPVAAGALVGGAIVLVTKDNKIDV